MSIGGGCAERSAPHDNSRHYWTAQDHIFQITRRPIPTGHNRTIPSVPRTRRAIAPHFSTNQNVISENALLSCITAQNRGHREGLCPDNSLLHIFTICRTTAKDSTAQHKTAEPFPALSGSTPDETTTYPITTIYAPLTQLNTNGSPRALPQNTCEQSSSGN